MDNIIILHGCSTIQLTRGQNTLIDAQDYRGLDTWSWFALPSHGEFYAARTVKDRREENPKNRTIRMHRSVAETHVGPCPPGMECRHINGDSLDNRSENLKWGTHSENMRDCIRHGTLRGAFRAGEPCLHNRGELNGSAKLKRSDVPEIRRRTAAGESQSSIARRYGVSRMAIWKIVEGKSWTHVGQTEQEPNRENCVA